MLSFRKENRSIVRLATESLAAQDHALKLMISIIILDRQISHCNSLGGFIQKFKGRTLIIYMCMYLLQ